MESEFKLDACKGSRLIMPSFPLVSYRANALATRHHIPQPQLFGVKSISDSSKPFDLQEFLKTIDEDPILSKEPEELLDNPTLEIHTKRIKRLEKNIQKKISKSEQQLFSKSATSVRVANSKPGWSEGFINKNGKKEKTNRFPFGKSRGKGESRNTITPNSSNSRSVLMKGDGPLISKTSGQRNNETQTKRNKSQSQEQVLSFLQESTKAASTSSIMNFSKHEPSKTKVRSRPSFSSKILHEEFNLEEPTPLQGLYVYGGSILYGKLGSSERNTFAKSRNFISPIKNHFFKQLDMSEFHDDELFFQTDDSTLVIVGLRKKRDGLTARSVTEIIELPYEIYPENLQVSRHANGTLMIEQLRHA